MLESKSFSIAIPAFKSFYLKECIESVLNQDYRQLELIIVNDASPEDIDSIVNGFNDKRIRYYKNEKNFGIENVVQNWNKALSLANYEYFVLLGDDDKLETNYLSEFSDLIDKYPNLDVFHCRTTIIDENGNKIFHTPSWPELESVYDNIWHRMSGYRTQYISDFVYKTEFLKNRGGFVDFPCAWFSDDITAYAACGTKGIAHTNKPVFNYRRSSITITNSGSLSYKLIATHEVKQWFNSFLEVEPSGSKDLITYYDIKRKIDRWLLKNKVRIISIHLSSNYMKNTWYWLWRYKKYKVTTKEFLMGMLVGLQRVFLGNN
jgi:glycosyltransferase involved in cell wall biosynthesis